MAQFWHIIISSKSRGVSESSMLSQHIFKLIFCDVNSVSCKWEGAWIQLEVSRPPFIFWRASEVCLDQLLKMITGLCATNASTFGAFCLISMSKGDFQSKSLYFFSFYTFKQNQLKQPYENRHIVSTWSVLQQLPHNLLMPIIEKNSVGYKISDML